MVIEINKPELEALIQERMASGKFESVEDVLLTALRASESEGHAQARASKKRLGQFLLESPLRDSGLKVERQKDLPRSVDL